MTSSLSSSRHFVPDSTSPSWNYDVFLSFRGEDTRKSFVDHLYTALVQQGIHTYKDDETLARGESIGPSLLKAIEESQIAVIVLSKNYADSSWCLDELAYVIECMDTRGQIVMPVFYDIDPSDVRRQNGKYREAFDKHESENKHKVESWRKALVRTGNLSGWVPRDIANGHEAKCIKDIVGAISGRLSLRITNINKNLIGIESRLIDLKSKLKIGTGGVHMVGIWGVGGGGKTTLASTAYKEMSHQFETHCFLEKVRDESSKHGLKQLQEKFLSLVLKTDVRLGSEIEGKSMIKRRLCHKSILVVLDDVDDLNQLEALAGSHDWFGEGTRIIITTRDEHLLTRHTDAIYEVSLLSQDEAIQLFSRYACPKEKLVEDFETLSVDVVTYAGGLPLAIEILGSFLYDKSKLEWKSALAKLKCIPDNKVTERLKISYDGLEPYQKQLFLDIACFLRRRHVDDVLDVLDACSFYPRIGIKVLVQKSLITVSNGIFEMHDLVEEMAHYIVRGEFPNNPEKHSRIWKEEDIVELCVMGAATLMENEVLALPSYTSNPSLPRVGANVEDVYPPTSPLPNYIYHPELPRVVANMKKLRWIYWVEYPTSSLPINFQPPKLGCLMLIRGRQKQLWQGCKCLPNLKILDLRDSKYLIRTPDFNGLPCLERLNLMGCRELKEIHPSIGYHERLLWVDMSICSKLKMFPRIIKMKRLETLNLYCCEELQKFPDIQSSMDSLVNVDMGGTDIEIIPSSVGKFCTNLVSFNLACCFKLKRIEGNFRLLKRLKKFHLNYCVELENLAGDFFDKECCLEVLSLSIKHFNSDLISVFKIVWNEIGLPPFHEGISVSPKFPQFPRYIRKLILSHCNLGDGDIPSDICELLNLQLLDLSCNKFSRLHSILTHLPCLKFLILSGCKSLVELPDLPSSIAILEAVACDSLESVGDLSEYKWLWKVTLFRENKLIGCDRVLRSMLAVNAVEDRFMSVVLPDGRPVEYCNDTRTIITLQLPPNGFTKFTGILLCDNYIYRRSCIIVIKQEMPIHSQPDSREEYDKDPESIEYTHVAYVPFGSLRHTRWWNPTYTNISIKIHGMFNPKVVLVPTNGRLGDSRERPKAALDCSKRLEEEHTYGKTFEIKDDLKSSTIQIVWSHMHAMQWHSKNILMVGGVPH